MQKAALRWWPLRGRRKLLAIGALASISLAATGWASAGPNGKALAPCRVWTVVPTPVLEGAYLEAVDATATDDVWAVGEYGGTYGIISHWDDTSWTMTTQQGISNSLSAVAAVSPSDVWAGGYKLDRNGHTQAFAEHWDGASWIPTLIPHPGYDSRVLSVAALASADVWAAGYYLDTQNVGHPLYAHWDGTGWTRVPSPSAGTLIYALAVVSSTDIWALGAQPSGEQFAYAPATEHWDGASWTPVRPARIPGSGNRQLLGGTAAASNDVWAVGYGEYSGTAIEHWDGSHWLLVKAPDRGNLQDAQALAASDVWAVGVYTHQGIGRATSEHWDGTKWTALPTPNPGHNSILLGLTPISPTDIWAVGWNAYPGTNSFPLALHSSGNC